MAAEKKTTSSIGKAVSVVLLIIGIIITLVSVVLLGAKPDERDVFLLGVILIVWGGYKYQGREGKGTVSERKEDQKEKRDV